MHLSKCSRCGEHLVANFWKTRKTRNPPTAQNTAFPAPRSQSWRAVHNTLPPPPARHKTPWPWCQRPVTDSILPGRCVRGIARGTPSPAQRKGSGMAGESGAGPRPPPLYNRRALPRRPATRTQRAPGRWRRRRVCSLDGAHYCSCPIYAPYLSPHKCVQCGSRGGWAAVVSRERPRGARASPRTAPARAARVQAGRTASGPPAPRSTSTTTVLLLKADCPSRPEVLIINGALAGRVTDVPRLGGHKGTG